MPALGTSMEQAQTIARSSLDGTVVSQVIAAVTNAGADRNDTVFALVLIGLAIGAGGWIGWEISRFAWTLLRNTLSLLLAGPKGPQGFQRPTVATEKDGSGAT